MLTDAPATLERPHRDPRARMVAWLVPLVVCAVGLLIPLQQIEWFRAAPGDIGDARFNTVILEHFHRWLTGGDSSMMSPPFYYPMPDVLTFSDNHWGTAWIYAILRTLGCSRYLALDWWYLVSFAANFAAMHIVLRRFGVSVASSAIGAYVFAFALPAGWLATIHAQFDYRCLAPVALLCLHRFLQGATPLWLGWSAVALAGQFYIAIYSGYFTVIVLASWTLGYVVLHRGGGRQWRDALRSSWADRPRHVLGTVALLVLAATATAVLMYPYVEFPLRYGFGHGSSAVKPYLPRPGSYLVADSSRLWSHLSARVSTGDGTRGELQLFVGLGVLALSVAGALLVKGPLKKAALAGLLVPVALTLDVAGHSIYLPLAELPGIGAIRAVARIIALLVLPLAVLAALGLDALRSRGRAWAGLGAVVAVAMMLEAQTLHAERFDIARENHRVSALQAGFPGGIHRGDVVFLPVTGSGVAAVFTELDAMVLAQDHGASTLNGYSGNTPPGYGWAPDTPACDQALARVLAAQREAPVVGLRLDAAAFAHLRVAGAPSCRVGPERSGPH